MIAAGCSLVLHAHVTDARAVCGQLVYNFTSFTLASMMACTAFFWLRLGSISEQYRTAVVITGLLLWIGCCAYAVPYRETQA